MIVGVWTQTRRWGICSQLSTGCQQPYSLMGKRNALMGFLCVFVLLWQALFVHEKHLSEQADHLRAGAKKGPSRV